MIIVVYFILFLWIVFKKKCMGLFFFFKGKFLVNWYLMSVCYFGVFGIGDIVKIR